MLGLIPPKQAILKGGMSGELWTCTAAPLITPISMYPLPSAIILAGLRHIHCRPMDMTVHSTLTRESDPPGMRRS